MVIRTTRVGVAAGEPAAGAGLWPAAHAAAQTSPNAPLRNFRMAGQSGRRYGQQQPMASFVETDEYYQAQQGAIKDGCSYPGTIRVTSHASPGKSHCLLRDPDHDWRIHASGAACRQEPGRVRARAATWRWANSAQR